MRIDSATAATTIGGLLGVLGGGAIAVVALGDWARGDEPTVAMYLLLGVFLSVFGSGLAIFSAVRFRQRLAWIVAVINALVLIVSLQGFRLL
jgi:hypothetical protein